MSFLARIFGARNPPAPKIVAHVAFDGAVRVIDAPTEDGWEYAEDAHRGDGFTVMVLRYVRSAPPEPLALLAKIYTFDPNRGRPEDPRETDWRAELGALFASIESVDVRDAAQLTMQSSLPGVEARLDGVGAEPREPLRIRERRSVAQYEQMIVTAMGSPRAFEELGPTIDRWFETSAFEPLAGG